MEEKKTTLRKEAFRALQTNQARILYRQAEDGKPSNGNPDAFDNNFSMTDPSGIRFDFRDGLRLMIPAEMEGEYHVTAMDAGTRYIMIDEVIKPGGSLFSQKRWRIPWQFTVTKDGKTVMEHEMDLKGREVALHFPKAGLGDTIAWFTYAYDFYGRTGCSLTVCMEERFRVLFESVYSELKWADEGAWRTTPFYAVYHLGTYSPDNDRDRSPRDFRTTGIHHAAADILGLPRSADHPEVATVEPTMPVPVSPYVCISTSASARCKEWLNPCGWPVVVDWLKSNGYNVVDIDRDYVHKDSAIPGGAVDLTGDIDLRERAAVLKGAAAFVGVSSGLSWLAWACGIPVVLISGFTLPFTEFYTPYRVINNAACTGCWNDSRETFDKWDDDYCPRHRDTPRQHECSKSISAYQVIKALSRALEDNK